MDSQTSSSKTLTASLLVIITIVISQFITWDLAYIGPIALSLDKLLAVIAFPIAIILFGIRRLRITFSLVLFGALLGITFTIAHIMNGNFGIFKPALMNLVINGATAVLLLTALETDHRSFDILAISWIALSVISTVLVVLQSYLIIPLLPSARESIIGGLQRGSGLIGEPCYMSMMIALGVAFTLTRRDMPFKILLIIIQSVGIMYTMTRMAFLMLGLLFLLSPIYLKQDKKDSPLYRYSLIIIAVVYAVGSLFITVGITNILYDRISEMYRFAFGSDLWRMSSGAMIEQASQSSDVITEHSLSSTDTRYMLLIQSLEGIRQHPLYGIGAWEVFDYMRETIGLNNEVHNTYLEFILTGGIAGSVTIGFFTLLGIVSLFTRGSSSVKGVRDMKLQIVSFLLMITLISIMHFFLLWMVWVYMIYIMRNRERSHS